jgi:DNA-binding NtrC family response regulator
MSAIRVLFIEDSQDDVFLAEHCLLNAGLEVDALTVQDERGLRDALCSWAPDLIVSDFAMPRLDGVKAFNIAHALAPSTPFLFRSGGVCGRQAQEAISRGAVGFVEKEDQGEFIRLVTFAVERGEVKLRPT